MTARPPLLIAGAGIAGLALGLALARRGMQSRILERRLEPAEAGAGIQLGPNAMKVLARLGVAERLEPATSQPDAIDVADGATGRHLTSLPLGQWLARRHGAPYRVAHRADLHRALLDTALALPAIEIVRDCEVTGFTQRHDGVEVETKAGHHFDGCALVGADGLWSVVRRALFPDHSLTYSGKMAARTVIPAPRDGSRFTRPVTGVWLSPDTHVVHYPVRGHSEIAIVAVVDEDEPREGWGGTIEATSVLARLIRFAPELIGFLGRANEWRAWSLYDPAPLPAWSRGSVGLIGDAAHPILPFLAQGGGMALEDAIVLAGLLADAPLDPTGAFTRFHAERGPRVLRVQDASRANGRIFHLNGLAATARNTTLRLAPGTLMMRRYDWLYGFDAG